jgi:hypothetical protein
LPSCFATALFPDALAAIFEFGYWLLATIFAAGLFVPACVFDASQYTTRKARWQRKFDRAKKM